MFCRAWECLGESETAKKILMDKFFGDLREHLKLADNKREIESSSVCKKDITSSEYQRFTKLSRDWTRLASDLLEGMNSPIQRDQDSLGTDV